jgi:hypothetical protein
MKVFLLVNLERVGSLAGYLSLSRPYRRCFHSYPGEGAYSVCGGTADNHAFKIQQEVHVAGNLIRHYVR